MRTFSHCHRVVLSTRPGFRILFCQTHQVVELEMGGVSMRLDTEAFAGISESMQLGLQQLQALDRHQVAFSQFMQQLNQQSS